MNPSSEREMVLFLGALALPAEKRASYLNDACAGDAALRQLVESLLQAHERAGDFLDQPRPLAGSEPPKPEPRPTDATQVASSVYEKEGDRIGRYKILQELGEGGCGAVYMAQQEEPVRRRVALKVIKLGMDTRQVIARFEAERQALALMDHPNIAKVLDAGATETGRPFFVMELVRGIKMTEYCDQHKVPTAERLKLFVQICHAIQHAHQKGIIHRDIKPSNILVTLHDGVPVPKVIDFGIAKATADVQLTDKTMFTRFEQFIGTPAYMSPEQAEMSGLDVDTRTDIYSLGVLCYELLTGQTPFDAKELQAAGLEEMRRTIREKEPVKPSTRLGTLKGDDLTTTASRRGLEAPKLINLLRGDLDWIVMKALEKDRTRRYETANGLAMDIERYLKNEPVVARPPSKLYRFHKTVRRNKLAFAAATAIAAALLVGLGLSTWMFFKEKDARQTAAAEALKSLQVAQFLQSMLKGLDPAKAKSLDSKMLREILDQTAQRLGSDLKGQPLVVAELSATLGSVYYAVGEYPKSEEMYRQALRLYESAAGKEQQKAIASVLNELGHTLGNELGRFKDAEQVLNRALSLNKELYGPVHTNVAKTLHGLAFVAWQQGDLVHAEAFYRESLSQIQKFVGEKHPRVSEAQNDLGLVLIDRGQPEKAEALFRKALINGEEYYGQAHPEVLLFRNNLGLALWYRGVLEEAESVHRRNLPLMTNVLSEAHPDVGFPFNNLALVLRDRGKLAEAEEMQRRAIVVFGPHHPFAARARNNLSFVLRRRAGQSGDLAPLKEALRLNPTDQLTADAFAGLASKVSMNELVAEQSTTGSSWHYTTIQPQLNWAAADFSDGVWASAAAVLAASACFPRTPKTRITFHTNLWLRREFELARVPTGKVMLRISRNQDAEVFLNGIQAAPVADWSDTPIFICCLTQAQSTLKTGRNVLAFHCQDADCGAPIEVGIYEMQDPGSGRKALLAEFNRLIEQEPQRPELYAARGNAYARLGQWSEAAADLSRAVELEPHSSFYAFQLGVVLIQKGDLAEYWRLRRAVLDLFAKPDASIIAQQIAEMSLLLPPEGVELKAAARLATEAVTAEYGDWNLPWRQLTKALAEYRQGRFDGAIDWANKVLATVSQPSLPAWNHERERNLSAAACLVEAMAQQQAGRSSNAHALLSKATEIIQTQFPTLDTSDLGREWPDMLIAQILLREAAQIIEGRAAPIESASKHN